MISSTESFSNNHNPEADTPDYEVAFAALVASILGLDLEKPVLEDQNGNKIFSSSPKRVLDISELV